MHSFRLKLPLESVSSVYETVFRIANRIAENRRIRHRFRIRVDKSNTHQSGVVAWATVECIKVSTRVGTRIKMSYSSPHLANRVNDAVILTRLHRASRQILAPQWELTWLDLCLVDLCLLVKPILGHRPLSATSSVSCCLAPSSCAYQSFIHHLLNTPDGSDTL